MKQKWMDALMVLAAAAGAVLFYWPMPPMGELVGLASTEKVAMYGQRLSVTGPLIVPLLLLACYFGYCRRVVVLTWLVSLASGITLLVMCDLGAVRPWGFLIGSAPGWLMVLTFGLGGLLRQETNPVQATLVIS
ncbi:MAG: hypothetical protein WC734_03060 [Patescibacteria group bacterium]|jgi:hypothetical protein